MAYSKKKIKTEYGVFAKRYARKRSKNGYLMIGIMIEN